MTTRPHSPASAAAHKDGAHRDTPHTDRPKTSALQLTLQIVCLLFAAYTLVSDVQDHVWQFPASPWNGTLGITDGKLVGGGFGEVTALDPGGALVAAGVAPGDRIRFDRRYDYRRRLLAGETVSFTLDHHGAISRKTVAARSSYRPFTAIDAAADEARPCCSAWP